MTTIVRIPLREVSTFQLPAEALAALGSAQEIYVEIDVAKQTVLLSVQHPDIVHNEVVLDQLSELNQGQSLNDYGEPVPESFLNRRGKGRKQDEEQ